MYKLTNGLGHAQTTQVMQRFQGFALNTHMLRVLKEKALCGQLLLYATLQGPWTLPCQ